MDNEYYILNDGEKTGPYTFDELTDMELNIHTQVLSPLADTWQDACDLPELYPYFEAQGIYLPTGDNLASFWWRLLAYVIDYVILSIVMQYVFILLAMRGITFHLQSIGDLMKLSSAEMFELQFITSATLIIYNSICEASPMRGSFGKRLCRLVVVDIDGVRLSYLNALLRSFGKALSIFFAYLGFISIFFTDHQQAVHDLIAKTYVVKRDSL
jgi:uncharacterized RDD family membrane protein YckC